MIFADLLEGCSYDSFVLLDSVGMALKRINKVRSLSVLSLTAQALAPWVALIR